MSDSIESLLEAIGLLPDNLALRWQLASELEGASRPEEALVHLTELLGRRPDDARAMLCQARCLYEVGRYAEAVERYDRAVILDVSLADAGLKERLAAAGADPRGRIRLVASGPGRPEMSADLGKERAERSVITFADVGGLDEIKEKIRLLVLHPLKRPDLYRAFGKKLGGGILLYGPPGCGKTFLARAAAGEAGLHFIHVGIEEVLDMWLGQSEKRLHELFRVAREKAPAILFFDEVDALGGRRSGLRHESYRTLVTQFLSELDGAQSQTENVLVLGATNAPWDVDPAFRRPGRFGEVIFVPPPDLRARIEILKLKLFGKPQGELDVARLAKETELFSGADLGHLVDAAVERALGESLRSGGVRPLSVDDLAAAKARVRPTTLEWFSTARNFATYANQSCQYDDVLDYMKRHRLG